MSKEDRFQSVYLWDLVTAKAMLMYSFLQLLQASLTNTKKSEVPGYV